jgi:hypothetical protein
MLQRVPPSPEASRLSFHHKLFLWAHVALAFLSMCVYVNQLAVGQFAFLPGAAIPFIFISMPAIWPYLVSASASWEFVSDQRFGFYLFLTALFMSGVLSIALALGAFGVVTDRWSLLGVYYYQTAAHYLISWLLDIEVKSPSNNRWRGP